tara:strand:+ start:138 stop:458 length:321 start_codon:yes stop_codon:yes gene_type:complete
LKRSLCAKEARNVLSSNSRFKTKNLSFKYSLSSGVGLAFSVRRQMGGAVLRNRFKRKARALFLGGLFNDVPVHVLIHPLYSLSKHPSLIDDFILFKNHLKTIKKHD